MGRDGGCSILDTTQSYFNGEAIAPLNKIFQYLLTIVACSQGQRGIEGEIEDCDRLREHWPVTKANRYFGLGSSIY